MNDEEIKHTNGLLSKTVEAWEKSNKDLIAIMKAFSSDICDLRREVCELKSEKKPAAKRKKDLVRPEKHRIHHSIYYSYAGNPEVYEANNMKNFAELHDIPFTFGWLNPTHRLIRDEKKRLIAEAELAMRLLEERGKRLSMFGYYLTADFKPVPHVVIFRNHGAEPQIYSWCKEYAEIVDYFDEAAGENSWHTDPKAAETSGNKTSENRTSSDMMDEIRQTCAKCVHRQKETKNTLISCSRHFYTIPQYHTKSHERKYLANVKKKGEIDFPNCFKPEGGEPCRAEK